MISKNKYGVISGVIVVLIWSGWVVVSKYGINNNLTEWDIVFIRFLISSLIVFPFFLSLNPKKRRNIFSFPVITCSLFCGNFYLITSLIGLKLSNASNIGVIVNGFLPIMSAIIIYLWTKEKINKIQFLAIALIVASSLILLSSKNINFDAFLLFLVSSACLSFYSVSINRWKIDLKTIMISVPIINFLFFLPFWIFLPSHLFTTNLKDIIFQAVYQGIIVSLVALFFMSYSIKILGAVRASSIMAFVPVAIILFSYYFLEEKISVNIIMTAILCTLGIILYNTSKLFKKNAI